MDQRKTFRYRSFFWPILLIGVGVFWLLASLDLIPRANWVTLVRLWPLLVIGFGLNLIFGRQSPLVGALISAGLIVVAIVLVIAGPSLGLTTSGKVVTESFQELIGSATSASLNLNLSVGDSNITALSDSRNIIEAEISHIGDIEFSTRGDVEKSISLRERETNFGIDWFDAIDTEEELHWDIGLSPDLPLYLDIEGGVGTITIDLNGLMLTGIDVKTGVGSMVLTLPNTGEQYSADIKVGVGNLELMLVDGIEADLDIEGGVGDTTIEVPDGLGVRIEAKTGIGDIRVSTSFKRISSDEDQFLSESGTWETTGFAEAKFQVTINYRGGVGNLSLR